MRQKLLAVLVIAVAVVALLSGMRTNAQEDESGYIFVTCEADDFITVIKKVTDHKYEPYGVIPTGGSTYTPVISRDNKLYFAAAKPGRGWVGEVDLNRQPFQVTREYDLTGTYGGAAFGLALTPDGRKLYVTERGNGVIVAITLDGSRPYTYIVPESGGRRGEFSLRYLVLSSDGKRGYAAGEGHGAVYVINLEDDTIAGSVPDLNSARGLALSTDNQRLYVGLRNFGQIVVVNTQTLQVVQAINIELIEREAGGLPSLEMAPNGKLLFVPVYYGFLRVIDTDPQSPTFHQVIAIIKESSFYKYGAYVTPDNEYLYVTSQSDRISDPMSLIIYEFGKNAEGKLWFEKLASVPAGKLPWLAVGTREVKVQ